MPFAPAWLVTVAIESMVLLLVLSPAHSVRRRLALGVWLSTSTLPLVHFVFPMLAEVGWSEAAWVTAAELTITSVECFLLTAVNGSLPRRDALAVAAANACSFGAGLLIEHHPLLR